MGLEAVNLLMRLLDGERPPSRIVTATELITPDDGSSRLVRPNLEIAFDRPSVYRYNVPRGKNSGGDSPD